MAVLLRTPLFTLTRSEAGSLEVKAKILHGLLAGSVPIEGVRRCRKADVLWPERC
jgi:hypothetical protein